MSVRADDLRLGSLVIELPAGDNIPAGCDICIIGFPHDEGVRRNGGRVGAAAGPRHFRERYKGMGTLVNPEFNVDLRSLKIVDAGDIDPALDLESAHIALTARVAEAIRAGAIPFVVGGGNDQSYPNAAGLLSTLQSTDNVMVMNIDAHLDVRPLIEGQAHSGSPFRQLMEDSRFANGKFIEFAAQGSQCSAQHVDYIKTFEKSQVYWLTSDLRKPSQNPLVQSTFSKILQDSLAESFQHFFISFDIDSITGADCPGVSCPGSIGLTAQEAFDICRLAGACPQVRLIDLSEYNPLIEAYRTGRLVANMFYFFALGVAQRKA